MELTCEERQRLLNERCACTLARSRFLVEDMRGRLVIVAAVGLECPRILRRSTDHSAGHRGKPSNHTRQGAWGEVRKGRSLADRMSHGGGERRCGTSEGEGEERRLRQRSLTEAGSCDTSANCAARVIIGASSLSPSFFCCIDLVRCCCCLKARRNEGGKRGQHERARLRL